jgi:hypothetical protein
MKGSVATAFAGVVVIAGSWLPLLIVTAHDRYAMPVGLGLVAFAGSFLGVVIIVIGVVRLLIQASCGSKARS